MLTSTEITATELPGVVADLLSVGWTPAMVSASEDTDGLRVNYTLIKPVGQQQELFLRVNRGGSFPSLARLWLPIGRFEREIKDLFGITPDDHPLPRRLVRHSHWPSSWHPLLSDSVSGEFQPADAEYPFLPFEGKGVYEIPVGPVHAGMIAPGHFRFFVLGETILRMKQRLWYVHRGIESLLAGTTIDQAIPIAERIAGDTAVGHSLALIMACEDALGVQVATPVAARRAILLECERLYNHIADIGMMGNDVGFGIANIHAGRLREKLLRHNDALTGDRLLRGTMSLGTCVWQGGLDLELLRDVVRQAHNVGSICLGHSVVDERLSHTAPISQDLAVELGCVGYVARAVGLNNDARVEHPFVEMPSDFTPTTCPDGDVKARFLVRLGELTTSLMIIEALADLAHTDPQTDAVGPASLSPSPGPSMRTGLGIVEAWRGRLVHRVDISDGVIRRAKIVDPSFFNWTALPRSLRDTIVPDFPLANKSFNQSYAGNDL